MEARPLEPCAPVRDHGPIRQRKRFADLERLQDVEPPAPVPEPETAHETDEARTGLAESILELQRAIGNRALSHALHERFALPGAPAAELHGQGAASLPRGPKNLRVGADELVRTRPAHRAPVSGPSGRGMDASVLRGLARSKLGPIPPGSGIRDPSALIDQLCEGVSFAWRQWQALAFFRNVVIQGPVALMGELGGPPLGPFLLAVARGSSDPEVEAAQALAAALDEGMKQWQSQPKFPGLPLYPSFAALPTPRAAPTPNVPFPVAALAGGDAPPHMTASGRASDPGARAVAQAVLDAITGGGFQMWARSTLVVNLIGHGPVPSFAPPYVPVGPVVGGTVLPIPGVLRS
jgi:hypothetical protein